jgi:hypothetical protein
MGGPWHAPARDARPPPVRPAAPASRHATPLPRWAIAFLVGCVVSVGLTLLWLVLYLD